MCQRLLDTNANPNVNDIFGTPPLVDAVFFGNEAAVELLLEAGARSDWQSLRLDDMEDSSFEQWRRILPKLHVHWHFLRSEVFYALAFLRWSFLHIAIWDDHRIVVRSLISHGADHEFCDVYNRTALNSAGELLNFGMLI